MPAWSKPKLSARSRPCCAERGVFRVFAGGEPEPSLRVAEKCIGEAREFRPDGVVGLGGGSNMDLAKMTATVLAHGGSPRDYLGEDRVPGPILPLICIPTTSGTGSEVSASGVFTDEENHIKAGAMSNYLRPAVAIVDPKLTLSCPRKVTADSGIDAMTHAIEAFTAVDNAAFPLPPGEHSLYQGATLWAIAWPSGRSRSSPETCRRPSTTRTTWRPARPCRWGRCWPGWRFRTWAWRWCMRLNIRWGRRRIVRTARAMACCCRT